VRLAALLHDVGKPFVEIDQPESDAEAHYNAEGEPAQETRRTFFGHQQAGAEVVRRWMERMRFSNEDVRLVTRLIEHHMVLYSPEWSDAAVRRFIGRAGKDLLDDLFNLVEADLKARGTASESLSLLNELKSRVRGELNEKVALSVKDLAVGGLDIMKQLDLEPGPVVGRILRALLDRVIEDPSLNRREHLLRLAGEIKEREQ
jgi:tRNA nucleotidyltransferase (CCA-adding enzyme)